jgi:uncharacterized protein YqeY
MTTKLQIENALKDALRAKDEARKRTIRLVLSAIKLSEVENGAALDEAGVNSILQKEIKSHRDTIADAERANRHDLIVEAQEEITILESFLPQMLSPDELESMVRDAISEVGAESPRSIGQVMKILMPKIQGRADGSQVNQIVRKLLS